MPTAPLPPPLPLPLAALQYFAAMLRLPAHMTKAQKVERVENVIQALGLTRCRDTIIGE